MPKPPAGDEVTELSFIVNYFLQGCRPPFWLMVELSREPLGDLALLLFGLDGLDIAQAIFGPKGGRNRDSGRHGRKSRRFRGFPDINDMVGDKIRTHVNPYDALRMGPTKFAFRIFNVYEGFNFAAALVESVTDVGFETLWGVMTLDTGACPTMPYMTRSDPNWTTEGGTIANDVPSPVPVLENINRMYSPNGAYWNCFQSDYTVGASALLYNPNPDPAVGFDLRIYADGSELMAKSSAVTLAQGESVHLSVEAEMAAGQGSWFSVGHEHNFLLTKDVSIFAFGGTWF